MSPVSNAGRTFSMLIFEYSKDLSPFDSLGNSSATPISLDDDSEYILARHPAPHPRRAERLIRASMEANGKTSQPGDPPAAANSVDSGDPPAIKVEDPLPSVYDFPPSASDVPLFQPDSPISVQSDEIPLHRDTAASEPGDVTSREPGDMSWQSPAGNLPASHSDPRERLEVAISVERDLWPHRVTGVVNTRAFVKWWSRVRPAGEIHVNMIKPLDDSWEIYILADNLPAMGECLISILLHIQENNALPDYLRTEFVLPPLVREARILGYPSFFMSMRAYRM